MNKNKQPIKIDNKNINKRNVISDELTFLDDYNTKNILQQIN